MKTTNCSNITIFVLFSFDNGSDIEVKSTLNMTDGKAALDFIDKNYDELTENYIFDDKPELREQFEKLIQTYIPTDPEEGTEPYCISDIKAHEVCKEYTF